MKYYDYDKSKGMRFSSFEKRTKAVENRCKAPNFGSEINMEKIVIVFILTLLTSCSITNSFLVYNDTDKDVSVTINYEIKNTDNVESFILQPRKSEFWMYEQSTFDSDVFYPQIESIKVSVENKCEVLLNRTALESIVKKENDEWQWIFDINQKLVNDCR